MDLSNKSDMGDTIDKLVKIEEEDEREKARQPATFCSSCARLLHKVVIHPIPLDRRSRWRVWSRQR